MLAGAGPTRRQSRAVAGCVSFVAQTMMAVASGQAGAVGWFWKGRTQPLSFPEAGAGQTSGRTLRLGEARRDGVHFSSCEVIIYGGSCADTGRRAVHTSRAVRNGSGDRVEHRAHYD